MKIGVLGTGVVGSTVGTKLVQLGHDVKMGSRSATNEKASAWVARAGGSASQGTFAQACGHGEIVFNCTSGAGAVAAVEAGAADLGGKIVVDISNPLDFSKGMPPTLLFKGDDSLGEQIQRAVPACHVVKALNTITTAMMVNPARVAGEHDVFVSGNDAGAKMRVTEILIDWFGWTRVVDLGDITTSRGTEAYLMLWLRLYGALKTADFNIKVVR